MNKVGSNGKKIDQQGQDNKLVEPYDSLLLVLGNAFIHPGMNNILIN
jgi:hypothetical protein